MLVVVFGWSQLGALSIDEKWQSSVLPLNIIDGCEIVRLEKLWIAELWTDKRNNLIRKISII